MMENSKSTITLSAQDFLTQLHTIRQVLEKVEETNGKVMEQIQIRANEKTKFADTEQMITDMKAKATRLGQEMDARERSLLELEISVKGVCSKVDDVVNGLLNAKQQPKQTKTGDDTDVGSPGRNARTENAHPRDKLVRNTKVKQSTESDDLRVKRNVQNSRRITQGRSTEETSAPLPDLPPIVNKDGFKSRRTELSSDNRHNEERLKQDKQRVNIKSIFDPNHGNVKHMSVRIREQEARFETDNKRIPGLSADSIGEHGDTFLADLAWQQWHSYAEEEKEKDTHRYIRKKGPDVVLCLDISQSMEGEPFEEMMSFAMKYVEGVEEVAKRKDLTENISITTFGVVTKVWLHLTSDYQAVKSTLREIHSLIPRGRSPIGGGLLVALAGCLGNGDPIVVGTVPVCARIILISDGMGTPDHIKTGPDLMRAQDEEMRASLRVEGNLKHVSKNLKKRRNFVYCVPVGNANTRALEEISKVSGGRVFGRLKRDRLIHWSALSIRAADLCRNCFEMAQGKSPSEVEALFRLFHLSNESAEDKEDVIQIATQLLKSVDGQSEEHTTSEHDPDLPPLGTRVRRGPGWHYPDYQDDHGAGTVCSHGRSGMVWVEWDNTHRNCYNYKGTIREVVPVTERRVLKRGEMVAPGCYVKRGDNWTNGNEDGGEGTMGVVTRVHQDGTVIVRWPNKKFKEYKFGSDGLFEVQVCTDETQSSSSQAEGPSNSHSAPEGEGLRIESFLPPP